MTTNTTSIQPDRLRRRASTVTLIEEMTDVRDAITTIDEDLTVASALAATAVQPEDIATVATTGDFNDLDNKPDIQSLNTANAVLTVNGEYPVSGDLTLDYADVGAAADDSPRLFV